MWIVGFILMQIVVFGVLLYFYKKVTGGDVESQTKRLGAVYEDLVQKQKELTAKIEDGEKELQAKKEEASTVAEKLSNQAMDEVRKKEDEILKKARGEAEEILAKAHASKETLRREIEIDVSKKTINFSVELLKNSFDPELQSLIHRRFIQNFIEQAKTSDIASIDVTGQRFVVRTAMPLKDAEKKEIQKVLYEKLGTTNFQVEEEADEKLVAGVALQIGTLMMDSNLVNSLKESSNKMKEKLKTE